MKPVSPPGRDVGRFSHGRVPRAVRRDQLLDLAEALFVERGYDAASMDELARRAGVTKPVVYDHFRSKESLFAACVERTGEALAQAVAAAAATTTVPRRQLRAASLAFFAFIAAQRDAWGALVDPDGAGGPFAQHALRIRRRQSDMTAGLLRASAEAAGMTVDEVRLGAIAQALIGTYEALAIWWRNHPEVSAEELTEWFLSLVWPGLEALLAGTGVPSPGSPACGRGPVGPDRGQNLSE